MYAIRTTLKVDVVVQSSCRAQEDEQHARQLWTVDVLVSLSPPKEKRRPINGLRTNQNTATRLQLIHERHLCQ